MTKSNTYFSIKFTIQVNKNYHYQTYMSEIKFNQEIVLCSEILYSFRNIQILTVSNEIQILEVLSPKKNSQKLYFWDISNICTNQKKA